MMKLTEIFAKDITRSIEGVVKADDADNLSIEVNEYVLTNEIAKGLEHLLETYTHYTNANGVWISGFFGSGKSHLLKMLAHLLGDVDGDDFSREAVSQSFYDKATDAFLPPLLDKAARIPARSLLFNIDQKAAVISKDQTDALLRVFVKVFDEARGYFGDQGHIAWFERQLDEEGLYDAFKDAFAEISGRDWTTRRDRFGLPSVASLVDQAYAQVAGVDPSNAKDILKTYQSNYAVSIEDFADDVKAWLDQQPDGYRLNFFVDEVGQFIGTNTQLMLNLQTIAESLNTKCRGRSWVIVTSQEDMDKAIGDHSQQQSNDFSKIQARFATRLKLTSIDVEEVIRKRLLEKNASGTELLQTLYDQESANFKTLLDFADGGKAYRNYLDNSHFINTYPFVPYQFPLFQDALRGLSDHNAFEGRHSSVGERSMLGVVQEVAKNLHHEEIPALASFDAMYEGVRASIKSAAQTAIGEAENTLHDIDPGLAALAVRLLKALFLVKYVDGFVATPRNLTVLAYNRFGLNLPELRKQVQEALALLESQTYIQRVGTAYEYLTNEEQEIEQEIKNFNIHPSELTAEINRLLSSHVIAATKFRYERNGQDFSFSYKIDDQVFGHQHELSLHFFTPAYPYELDEIRMHSAGKDELRVVLAPDERIMAELSLLLKTQKYTKQKQSGSLSPQVQQILMAKGAQNQDREREVIERLERAITQATLVINSGDITTSASDARARIQEGFQELVRRTYINLGMLNGATYGESEIVRFANTAQGSLDEVSPEAAASDDALITAGTEVLSHITQHGDLGQQVTVKKIVDSFEAKPYGWDITSIEAIIAWLVGRSKVSLAVDSNVVNPNEVAAVLRNTQKHAHTVIKARKTYDPQNISNLRSFCVDFFDSPNVPTDPLELARHTKQSLEELIAELNELATHTEYPFVSQLHRPVQLLSELSGHPDEWYLTNLTIPDELLDAKSDVIGPIQAFMNGHQRVIFDEALSVLQEHENNLHYLPPDSSEEIRRLLSDPAAFSGKGMVELKDATLRLHDQLNAALAKNRDQAVDEIGGRWHDLKLDSVYIEATPEMQSRTSDQVERLIQQIESEPQIAVVRDLANDFEQRTFPRLIDQLSTSAQLLSHDASNEEPTPQAPVRQTVSIRSISVPNVPRLLTTEEGVDRYLANFRIVLLEVLNDDKHISL